MAHWLRFDDCTRLSVSLFHPVSCRGTRLECVLTCVDFGWAKLGGRAVECWAICTLVGQFLSVPLMLSRCRDTAHSHFFCQP